MYAALFFVVLLASDSCHGFSSLVHHRTRQQNHRSLSTTHLSLSSTNTAAPNYASVGKLISESKSIDDLLHAADNLWIPPNDIIEATPDLPPHLLQQQIQNEKRLRWSSQILTQLGEQVVAEIDAISLLSHPSLEQAVLAATIPFQNDMTTDRETKELRYLNDALQGIYNIVSVAVLGDNMGDEIAISQPVLQAIQLMFERVENMAGVAALPHAVELRWSCRGITCKLERMQPSMSLPLQPKLEARTEQLPFDILFSCVDWKDDNIFGIDNNQESVERLQQEIPFETDTIVTRTGAAVQERRATAWIAEEGIGALAYSGKLMAPQPISPVIHQIMAKVEDSVLDNNHLRPFFDCALCNHYPDGDSACKFHTDPEHGSHWERLTCVVAAGEPRRFAFRSIPGHSTWSEWDESPSSATASVDANLPAVLTLFPGDVVKMEGTCNDDFHHAVYPEQGNKLDHASERQGRVSLVLKRAIDRNGKKGHGVAGQGRRARRRSKYDASTSDAREQDGAINTSPNNKPRRRRRR